MEKNIKIDCEPKWSNLGNFIIENKNIDGLQPILNLYQGFRDLMKRKETKYAKAVYNEIVRNNFNISDLQVKK